ncbi:MAG TPA: maleylpyruvate isomerase N-terminal domain-containing protein [Streptosporangiaceae bacterium]
MEHRDSWDRSVPLAAPVSAPAAAGLMTAYDDGVRAVLKIAAGFTQAAWEFPTPCEEWRAADLAAHLRCVAEDYHEYLDEAPESRLSKLLASGAPGPSIARKLARQNAAELAVLPEAMPDRHIAAFARSAASYAIRVTPLLDLPHHSYRGRVITVAGMAGAACVEWHVHAWDLAGALGLDYRPARPEYVRAAWLAGIAQVPLQPHDDPWVAVLRSSGRTAG